MSNTRIITDIYGLIEENEEGNEGIFPIFNGSFYVPFMVNHEEALADLIKFIKDTIPYKKAKRVVVARFSHRIDLKRIK